MRYANAFKVLMAVTLLGAFLTYPFFAKKAEATNYNKTSSWDVKGSDPGQSSDQKLSHIHYFYSCMSECPSTATGTWASDWSWVDCVSDERPEGGYDYYMLFHADDGDWPSSWPSTVTCTYSPPGSGDTYSAVATLYDAPTGFWTSQVNMIETGWNPSNGLTIAMQSLNSGAVEMAKARWVEAPSAAYVDGCWNAVRNGAAWTGVKCCANDRTDRSLSDVVGAGAGETAVAGTGTCVIPKDTSPTTYLTFDLTLTRP